MVKHFLLAEDDEDDIEIINEAIKNSGLSIILTSVIYCDGIFHSLTVPSLPDVIIVDGNLPGKTLLECLSEIREHEKLCNIPLVVLSNTSYKAVRDKSYAAGVNLYLEKPDSFTSMEDIIKRLFYIDWHLHPVLSSESFFQIPIEADKKAI